jgi:peptidoglycan/xylan/chitin deacetylase (PgdA/CDA1 family)
LCAWAALYPGSQLFGRTVQHTDRGSALALSFDDGPNPVVTPQVIDLLDYYKVRATFFLIGRHVRACPGLAREIAVRGHAVGNHTDTHPSLLWMPRQRIVDELSRCQDSIERATGNRPTLMRPPYGYRGPQLQAAVRQAGLKKVVMWSVAVSDWKVQPPMRLIKRLRRARGGDIVVLHDGDPNVLGADRAIVPTALEFWLPRWRDEGVEFVAIDAAEANRPAPTTPVA